MPTGSLSYKNRHLIQIPPLVNINEKDKRRNHISRLLRKIRLPSNLSQFPPYVIPTNLVGSQ